MKTIEMLRDFTFRARHNLNVQYQGAQIYRRVPEAAVRAILAAGAGRVVEAEGDQ